MTTFTTYKRWTLQDEKDESDLVDIVANHIIPHYQRLDPIVRLELLRVSGTRSYLALQHWPSRADWETVRASNRFASWYQAYEPILAHWDQIMEFEAEWEAEAVL